MNVLGAAKVCRQTFIPLRNVRMEIFAILRWNCHLIRIVSNPAKYALVGFETDRICKRLFSVQD